MSRITTLAGLLTAGFGLATLSPLAFGQDASDLAQQLANPIASLISVPIQFNYDSDYGADDDGSVVRINVQPVVPFSLNDNLNLISRTILPILDQNDVPSSGINESGLGDTVQSLFFSPKEPTAGGWIWGAGPVMLLPTATDDFLGGDKWGLGPTGVVLRQSGQWTYGALANHIESVGGDSNRADISATFLQPFLTYITPNQTTYAVNFEATYDWESDQWSTPMNVTASQLLMLGDQVVQIGAGVRYWLSSPASGAEHWGLRLNFIMLFPQ